MCSPPSSEKFALIEEDLVPPSQTKAKQTASKAKEAVDDDEGEDEKAAAAAS